MCTKNPNNTSLIDGLRRPNPCKIIYRIHSPGTSFSGKFRSIIKSTLILNQTNFQTRKQWGLVKIIGKKVNCKKQKEICNYSMLKNLAWVV